MYSYVCCEYEALDQCNILLTLYREVYILYMAALSCACMFSDHILTVHDHALT